MSLEHNQLHILSTDGCIVDYFNNDIRMFNLLDVAKLNKTSRTPWHIVSHVGGCFVGSRIFLWHLPPNFSPSCVTMGLLAIAIELGPLFHTCCLLLKDMTGLSQIRWTLQHALLLGSVYKSGEQENRRPPWRYCNTSQQAAGASFCLQRVFLRAAQHHPTQ